METFKRAELFIGMKQETFELGYLKDFISDIQWRDANAVENEIYICTGISFQNEVWEKSVAKTAGKVLWISSWEICIMEENISELHVNK